MPKIETQMATIFLHAENKFGIAIMTQMPYLTVLTEEEAKKLRNELDLHLMDIELSKGVKP